MMEKGRLLYEGKAKSLYVTDNANQLICEFRDDLTAFNGEKRETIARKGATNCAISNFIMHKLAVAGVPSHFIQSLSPTAILVKKLTMIPLESVVRNVAAGSICKRLGLQKGAKLVPPLYELFYKNDALGDPFVSTEHALYFKWATAEQLQTMHHLSLRVNEVMQAWFAEHDLLLVDFKLEFGVDNTGAVMLADEISPDACRIWDAKTGESFDKDRFRQGLGSVIEFYRDFAQRVGIPLEIA